MSIWIIKQVDINAVRDQRLNHSRILQPEKSFVLSHFVISCVKLPPCKDDSDRNWDKPTTVKYAMKVGFQIYLSAITKYLMEFEWWNSVFPFHDVGNLSINLTSLLNDNDTVSVVINESRHALREEWRIIHL